MYSNYIDLDLELIELLKSFDVKSEIPSNTNGLMGDTIRLRFIHFHILLALSKDQNNVLSKINDNFFNELSIFKDKLFIVFNYDRKSITPISIEYWCSSNKISLSAKKKLLKLFNSMDLPIRLNKTRKPQPITRFIFD